MAEEQELRISLVALLAWVLVSASVVGALGVYPTWYWSSQDGLRAQAWAFTVVLVAMVISGILIVRASRQGAAAAAMTFVVVSMARMGICMLLTVVGWFTMSLPLAPLLIWMFVLYIVMLFAEVGWLTRALHRGAILAALSKIGRRRRAGTDKPEIKGV